jgi:glycosyltransferase involved in cell wall biosynthesis
MRVAYVHDEVLPNRDTDSEQLISTAAAMARQGAEVVLFLPSNQQGGDTTAGELREHYQVSGDFHVEHLRSINPAPRWLEKLGHALRAVTDDRLREFDVVHTRNISTMVSLVASRHPVTYETYRPWARQYPPLRWLFRAAMRRDSFLGAVLHSAYARDHYVELGVPEARLAVVYNGYEPSRLEPRLSRGEARELLGLEPERPVVTYVGRATVQKGVDRVIDMAARTPSATFLIVGHEGDAEIERRAGQVGNVRLYGWQRFEAIGRFLFAADALVLPPTLRPLTGAGDTVLPMKLFTYLAVERPILAPRAPDTAELLEHGVNAQLVEPDDLDAAVAGLAALLSDRELARRIAAGAAATAQTLTWDARAERLLAFMAERRLAFMAAAVNR